VKKINKINFLKWASVFITILAALTISLRLTEIITSYLIFLFGHILMFYIMLKTKDWSLFFMNLIWVLIDIIGIIKWSS
jgi:hypothetical protein